MKLPDMPFQFECVACGRCCRRPGDVFLEPEELEAAARHLGTTTDDLIDGLSLTPQDAGYHAAVTSDSPCPFLEGDLCSIHPVKPSQCRTYPFWPEIVADATSWRSEAPHCPGIGRGKVYSRRDVRALMRGQGRTDEEI
jgi:uncharacterized protein